MEQYKIPNLPLGYDLETKEVLKQVNRSNKKLAELKGVAKTIPNERILISCLTLQEAKDSSAIENIVTTQDDLYQAGLGNQSIIVSAAAKEVLRYREAISHGFILLKKNNLLTINVIKDIQRVLVENNEGFRTVPGTSLKSSVDGRIVYTPPQDIDTINRTMSNLEQFVNDDKLCDYDPLVKMAIIHHQFESIHPFGDGNGRTGRIMNILYLIQTEILDLPILYLSRFITHHKAEYYRLLQAIRDKQGDNFKEWEEWILFILKGIEETADFTIDMVKGISTLMVSFKTKIRPAFGKKYKHDLLNNLFFHPYTKIEFLMNDLTVSRPTAAKYLEDLTSMGLLEKVKMGKENYFINTELVNLFMNKGEYGQVTGETIITHKEIGNSLL
ncbi:MAG: Fic family protein [Prevotella sp.]